MISRGAFRKGLPNGVTDEPTFRDHVIDTRYVACNIKR
jgi:hypothetical protein